MVAKPPCSGKQKEKPKQKKVHRLSNLDVSEFLVANGIKCEVKLFAKASEQKDAGKKDLANFLLSRSPKSLQDLIATTWKTQSTKQQIQRNSKPRMEVIRKHASEECVSGCEGDWLECAQEVLRNNAVHPIVFTVVMNELLSKGRGKFRNMIVGSANWQNIFAVAIATHF